MSEKESISQLESLIEHFNNGGLDLNATDIKAIQVILKENVKLKQALNEIKTKIDGMKCEFELNGYVTNFIEKLDNELQIIDKYLGDEKYE